MFSGKMGNTKYLQRSGPDELSPVQGYVCTRFYQGQQEEYTFEELCVLLFSWLYEML